tara:strand:+ start:498 stop:614 length:117 start_codon:yes stop_codon:yes gene_type:complete
MVVQVQQQVYQAHRLQEVVVEVVEQMVSTQAVVHQQIF